MAAPGFVLWLTGLPASGKSTLARSLQRALALQGVSCVILDSDDLRAVLTPEPSYTPAERDWFYEVVGYLALWLARSGVNVLVAATANRRRYRHRVRQQLERFAEVYVCCPLAVAQERDPKRLYARVATGQVAGVPGADAPYEIPLAAEARVDTADLGPDEAAAAVLAQLATLIAA